MTAAVERRPRVRRLKLGRALPYVLSLPALVVCIGILIPFFTSVYYSMLRFRLNLPALKGLAEYYEATGDRNRAKQYRALSVELRQGLEPVRNP